jgi:kynurenine formamidase
MSLEEFCALLGSAHVIDLSQTLEERMPGSPNHAKFFQHVWGSYDLGDRSLNLQVSMSDHSGTHVDAPAHFIGSSRPEAHVTVDRIPIKRFLARGCRIDCRSFEEGGYVSRAFLTEWERQHGELRAEDIVLLDFGWASRWALRPDSGRYLEDFPGVGMDAAEYLVQKLVKGFGVDTLSPDPPEAHRQKRAIHPFVLEHQLLIFENLTNLSELPHFFAFLGLPLKIRGGSGSPLRAIALTWDIPGGNESQETDDDRN